MQLALTRETEKFIGSSLISLLKDLAAFSKPHYVSINNKHLTNIFVDIVKEEDFDKDINCLELVEDILPDLTIDNVEKLAGILQKEGGCSIVDPKYNTILRRFHRIRYVM